MTKGIVVMYPEAVLNRFRETLSSLDNTSSLHARFGFECAFFLFAFFSASDNRHVHPMLKTPTPSLDGILN
jgi:hypothetical protein